MRSFARRGAVALGLLVLVLGVPVIVVSPSVAEHLLFLPDRTDPGPPPPLGPVTGRTVTLRTSDGVRLRSWWYEAGPEAPAVLLLHGNAGHIGGRLPLARGLVERGVSVFLLEYRGYGGNDGRATIEGLTRDAGAGLDHLARRIGPGRTVVFGRSVGGAVGAQALRRGTAAGLILEAAFTSLEEIAAAVYPVVPSFFFRRLRGHLETREALRELSLPVLVVHGGRDRIVPMAMGRELYEAAAGPKEWYGVPGAGHNDVHEVAEGYFDRLAGFVRRSVERPR